MLEVAATEMKKRVVKFIFLDLFNYPWRNKVSSYLSEIALQHMQWIIVTIISYYLENKIFWVFPVAFESSIVKTAKLKVSRSNQGKELFENAMEFFNYRDGSNDSKNRN